MIHILIADPDSAMSKALRLLLQREFSPVSIHEVRDVENLIRALTETTPDVLLLDWKLYGSPAPDTFRLLRKAYSQLKVILLSAEETNRCQAQAVGADFIYKGVQPDEMIAALRTVLTPNLSM